jgi:ABC-type transport system substrate-binding protein
MWTIRLRGDIRWHDGVQVTAHDMKITPDLLQHPDTLQFAPGGYEVSVFNDRTYTITYHRLDPGDDGAINNWTARSRKQARDYKDSVPKCMLAKTSFGESCPKANQYLGFLVASGGCGPYRHVRTVAQDHDGV